MTASQVLYDYSLQITGNKRQAKVIVHYVILEGARVLAETGDAEAAQAFMVTKVRVLSYQYTRQRKRWFRRMWDKFKSLVR